MLSSKHMEFPKGRVTYNKLIRDKVPENMDAKGVTYELADMTEAEYIDALKRKMVEESNELLQAETIEDALKELADLLEVIDAYKKIAVGEDALNRARIEGMARKGGFEKRIKLLWSE